MTRMEFVIKERKECIAKVPYVCMDELLTFCDYLCFDKGKSGAWYEIVDAIENLHDRYFTNGYKNKDCEYLYKSTDERFEDSPIVLHNLYSYICDGDKEIASKINNALFAFWYSTMNGSQGGTNFLMYKGLDDYFHIDESEYDEDWVKMIKGYIKPYKLLKFIDTKEERDDLICMLVSKKHKVFAVLFSFDNGITIITKDNVKDILGR